ncbi:MAG: SAM-dependent methyltransferase, partial [Acidobacteria bacterium]|nr:SAM-dependent methyltransferase [Acidobacteriota bacterium]
MDKALRNTLRNVVTQCRKLLEEAINEILQGQFGIHKNGEIEDASRMGHLWPSDQAYREQVLVHLQHIRAGGFKPADAVEQLIREVAFTHLNRLVAYKMLGQRKLIREAVSRGINSNGFKFYLADHPDDETLWSSGQQDVAYRHFLEWLGGTLSEEIGVLFSPHDPANRLFPRQQVLDQVLALINSEELKDIWTEDETIGWVYQYFTPKELREKARKESSAPRNSYELAFRNQFYTPRYVVQFLTDNTLGRIWYEMRKGETVLKEKCQYLVRRPNEVFLSEGEINARDAGDANDAKGEKSQEELLNEPVFIPHRPTKDPREIKILDPACGSGHFLIYCFDLLLAIYEEAWDQCPDLLSDLRASVVSKEEFMKQVPGLILRHNLHGIDIDLRATQIAALALWLRAQRAYQELGLKRDERPKITKSNIVCAEPMPGEEDLLEEFLKNLRGDRLETL